MRLKQPTPTARPISSGELYSAMQQGVVDGQENPWTCAGDRGHRRRLALFTRNDRQLSPQYSLVEEFGSNASADDL